MAAKTQLRPYFLCIWATTWEFIEEKNPTTITMNINKFQGIYNNIILPCVHCF